MTGASPPCFEGLFRETFEDLVAWRRDVRRFRRDAIDPALIERLIRLSCLSPSVGNSQPWRFVRVASPERRALVRDNFLACNAAALSDYEGEQARLYASLKLAGLDDAPVHLAVFCDGDSTMGHGLGRKTMPEMLAYSVVAAVTTFWLAARIEGLGVGWVSILDAVRVREALAVPEAWFLVAYLCVGVPSETSDIPELVRAGWQDRAEFARFLLDR
jgi:5,6-dimethylbenzimidazole synthase